MESKVISHGAGAEEDDSLSCDHQDKTIQGLQTKQFR